MRRIIAKHPDTSGRIKGIIQAYSEQGIMGICDGPLQVEPPTCPPPFLCGKSDVDQPGPHDGRACRLFLHQPR